MNMRYSCILYVICLLIAADMVVAQMGTTVTNMFELNTGMHYNGYY